MRKGSTSDKTILKKANQRLARASVAAPQSVRDASLERPKIVCFQFGAR